MIPCSIKIISCKWFCIRFCNNTTLLGVLGRGNSKFIGALGLIVGIGTLGAFYSRYAQMQVESFCIVLGLTAALISIETSGSCFLSTPVNP